MDSSRRSLAIARAGDRREAGRDAEPAGPATPLQIFGADWAQQALIARPDETGGAAWPAFEMLATLQSLGGYTVGPFPYTAGFSVLLIAFNAAFLSLSAV